ncbi:hypothetical protein [Carnobacterium maltaromaticum]
MASELAPAIQEVKAEVPAGRGISCSRTVVGTTTVTSKLRCVKRKF